MNAAEDHWCPCPFCGAQVTCASTDESFSYAGSTYWSTRVFTACGCFDERWSHGKYGKQTDVHEESRRVWNTRPNGPLVTRNEYEVESDRFEFLTKVSKQYNVTIVTATQQKIEP